MVTAVIQALAKGNRICDFDLDPQTVSDIKEVQRNVRRFAEAQRESIRDFELEIQRSMFLG